MTIENNGTSRGRVKELEEINASLLSRLETVVEELRIKDDILIQQSRLYAMSELIGVFAHQWRQPLNNIGLIVQELHIAYKAGDLSVDDFGRDVAETMKIIKNISDNIEDFSNFFRYEEKTCRFVINELFSRLFSFVNLSLKKNGIRIMVEEESEVTAEGRPNEYAQALFNVIFYLRDMLLEREPMQPMISIRIFSENGRSVVTLRDNGGGIEDDILPNIFDLYSATGKPGMAPGLFMAKTIIEKKMHGSLSAYNVEGGSEFRIEI